MLLLTNLQKIYISSVVIASLLAIILIIVFIYKFIYTKKHFEDTVYFKLASLDKINDFLLLNNYVVDFDDSHVGIINHILISIIHNFLL